MKPGPKSKKTEEELERLDELGFKYEGWKKKQLERINEKFLKLLKRESEENIS